MGGQVAALHGAILSLGASRDGAVLGQWRLFLWLMRALAFLFSLIVGLAMAFLAPALSIDPAPVLDAEA